MRLLYYMPDELAAFYETFGKERKEDNINKKVSIFFMKMKELSRRNSKLAYNSFFNITSESSDDFLGFFRQFVEMSERELALGQGIGENSVDAMIESFDHLKMAISPVTLGFEKESLHEAADRFWRKFRTQAARSPLKAMMSFICCERSYCFNCKKNEQLKMYNSIRVDPG